jgi:hypothetical protein
MFPVRQIRLQPRLDARLPKDIEPYNDPECRACDTLPICGGGCASKRLRTRLFGEKGHEFCSLYKTHLLEYLDAYIDTVRTREISTALLQPGVAKTSQKGYQIISPAPRKDRPSLTTSDTAN